MTKFFYAVVTINLWSLSSVFIRPKCKHKWCGHEEKETDVNIALAMLDLAYKDKFDHAFLISNDSDLASAIHMVRKNFPHKLITTIVPPHYKQ